MSRETSPRDSQSESSNSSPNPVMKSQKDLTDLTLFGGPILRLNRSATIRRASTLSTKKEEPIAVDDYILPIVISSDKYRKSLESSYRHSLESISEYRAKSSFSATGIYPSRNGSSLDSTSSDCTDYAIRSSTETFNKDNDKTFTSPSSSYLSWIESVNSEYFGNTPSTSDIVDVDNKVGEWNNFWLNYNSPNNRYLSSYYLCAANNDDKTGDDLSDCKSSCSTQKEFNDKLSGENVLITYEEITEIIRCSQRITEILQKVVKRNDEIDQSANESYYSQFYSQPTTSYDEDLTRERTFTYVVDPKELQKQQQLLKPTTHTNSCINVLLNTGVADILKRVISKRREVIGPEETPSTSRSSFYDWSSGK